MSEPRESRRLLLVEDDSADAQLVADLLEEGGGANYDIHHVARLEAALDRAGQEAFDAVLLDLGLPDSQGLETVRAFQQGTGAMPVVVLTGQDNRELGTQAIQLGIQDFLLWLPWWAFIALICAGGFSCDICPNLRYDGHLARPRCRYADGRAQMRSRFPGMATGRGL